MVHVQGGVLPATGDIVRAGPTAEASGVATLGDRPCMARLFINCSLVLCAISHHSLLPQSHEITEPKRF